MNIMDFKKIANKIAVFNDPVSEGEVGAPPGQIISLLQSYLNIKYVTDAAYRSLSDRLRGPWREAMTKHMYEHAEDERNHAYAIAMKIIGFGGDPIQTSITIPDSTSNLISIISVLADLELQAIKMARGLLFLSGEDDGLRVLVEDILLKDSHHLDDLRRIIPNEEQP
jgi:bacterioferritin (cytochrome b1)